jgi:ferredoxin-type protein NapF
MAIDKKKRSLFKRGLHDKQVVRLPWLKEDISFTELCTRCDNCITACPTNIIHRGSGGFPELDFTINECLLCKDCITSCDIDLFDLHQDAPWGLKATIGNDCLNSKKIYCRSCSDSCEIEAISFKFTSTILADPIIDNEACTGCGACVSSCPSNVITMQVPEINTEN